MGGLLHLVQRGGVKLTNSTYEAGIHFLLSNDIVGLRVATFNERHVLEDGARRQ